MKRAEPTMSAEQAADWEFRVMGGELPGFARYDPASILCVCGQPRSKKSVAMCHRCRYPIQAPQEGLGEHGSYLTYNNGCHCEACRTAKRERYRLRR